MYCSLDKLFLFDKFTQKIDTLMSFINIKYVPGKTWNLVIMVFADNACNGSNLITTNLLTTNLKV